MMLQSKNKTKGFTLIELIMVIVLLGILAATALPRFANMTGQAETAAFNGVRGAFAAGVSIAHAQWLVEGSNGDVTLDGGDTIAMSAAPDGWPQPATFDVGGCEELYDNLLQALPTNWTATGVDDGEASLCIFTDDNNNAFTYRTATGSVDSAR